MRLFHLFILTICSPYIGANAFINKPPKIGIPSHPPPIIEPPTPPTIQQKINGFIDLTRIKRNIIPITILNLLNGMIIDPSHISIWIKTPSYIAASTMVYLLTSGSMVINDLYDIKVDKINNPTRPLISGIIKPYEAAIFSGVLFTLYLYLGIFWLPDIAEPIWKLSLAAVLLYTPFLKRIPLIKNLTCASIIASTVPFIGLSINPKFLYSPYLINAWIPLTIRTLFVNSMFIEIILDISDREGDSKTGIYTLPVLIGSQNTSWFLASFLFINYIQSILLCAEILDPVLLMAILTGYLPLFINIGLIQKSRFSNSVLKTSVLSTTGSMIVYFMIYIFWVIYQ